MKVGDLVNVERNGKHNPFVSIITAICLPKDQVNGMHLVEVLRQDTARWYPVGYIRVISESR